MPAFNPSSIRIQRMLGATKPVRPPTLPRPMATPKLGSSLNLHSMMRPMRAQGGGIVDSPEAPFTGGILSTGAGRAWAVSHMGEGNTVNGLTQLKLMFGSPWGAAKAPFGAPQPTGKLPGKGIGIPKPPPAHFQPPMFGPPGYSAQNPALEAHGGAAHGAAGAVPINASGGEFVITPDEVARIGDGNATKGHRILDKWVLTLKKEAVHTLNKLPGPAR